MRGKFSEIAFCTTSLCGIAVISVTFDPEASGQTQRQKRNECLTDCGERDRWLQNRFAQDRGIHYDSDHACAPLRPGNNRELHYVSPLTHEEIAQIIGAFRETVTRLFADFRKKQSVQI